MGSVRPEFPLLNQALPERSRAPHAGCHCNHASPFAQFKLLLMSVNLYKEPAGALLSAVIY
jgi:hypothetical protein